MSYSYVPDGTFAVCTFQMDATPRKFIAQRPTISVFHGEPLLNIDDKNIDVQFPCRNPANLFATLLAFGLGMLAVGALVLSGPIGWVAIGVGAACIIGSAYVATQISHKCTGALGGGNWIMPHSTVNINGSKAVTHLSMLQCGNGGILKAFFSYSIACSAAEQISDNNKIEVMTNAIISFAAGVAIPLAFKGGFAWGIAGKLVVTNIVGTGIMWGLTYGQREYMRSDDDLEDNPVYQTMNEDDNSFINPINDPSDPSDMGDLYDFLKQYKGSAGDRNTANILRQIEGMNRQQLNRSDVAKTFLRELNEGKHPQLREAMTRFNQRRMNPTMVREASARNAQILKGKLASMGRKAGTGILFFLPMVSTFFSENARKEFAIAAMNDISNGGTNVVASKPL